MQNHSVVNSLIDKHDLRKFGFLFAAVLMGLFGLLLPWWRGKPPPLWPFYIGVPVAVLALLIPAALRPLYAVWMKFGAVMGFINTRIIMSVFFFVVLTPMAWMLRIAGKDLLARKMSETVQSYRITSETYSKEQMEKPY
jgi:hypothetical protein